MGKNSKVYKSKKVLIISFLVAAIFTLSLLATKSYLSFVAYNADLSKNLSKARQVTIGCISYPRDSQGNLFPESLNALLNDNYIESPSNLTYWDQEGGNLRFHYAGTGKPLDESVPPEIVIYTEPNREKLRVIGYSDGSTAVIKDSHSLRRQLR